MAYVRSSKDGVFVFGLTRRRNKQISMPYVGADLTMDNLLDRILEMRRILERALECDIRQYCFPERIAPLKRFLE